MDYFELVRKYSKELAPYDEQPIEPYDTDMVRLAAFALAESDRLCELQDNTKQAHYGRYEFRQGAAYVLCDMFGLDLDMARSIMRTRTAWVEYEQAEDVKPAYSDEF